MNYASSIELVVADVAYRKTALVGITQVGARGGHETQVTRGDTLHPWDIISSVHTQIMRFEVHAIDQSVITVCGHNFSVAYLFFRFRVLRFRYCLSNGIKSWKMKQIILI